MARVVTIHEVADRHSELHGRSFGRTRTVEAAQDEATAALAEALTHLDLSDSHDKLVVTLEWPHDHRETPR